MTAGAATSSAAPFDLATNGLPIDCAVITTDHSTFDYARIAVLPLVVDTRNVLKQTAAAHIFQL